MALDWLAAQGLSVPPAIRKRQRRRQIFVPQMFPC